MHESNAKTNSSLASARVKKILACEVIMTKLSRYANLSSALRINISYEKRRQGEREKSTTKTIEREIKDEIRSRIQQAHKQAEV